MKNKLLIWGTILALAFIMSFSTVLSFAEEEGGEAEPVDLSTCTVTWPKSVNFNAGEAINAKVTVELPDNGGVVPESEYSVLVDPPAVTKSATIIVYANEDSKLIKGTASSLVPVVYPMSTKYVKVTLSKTSLPVKFKKNNDSKVITVNQKPTVKVTNPFTAEVLKKGTDYTVTFPKTSKNAGTYSIKVTMKGNYTGAKTVKFKITPKKLNASEFSVWTYDKFYTGKRVKPKKVYIDYYNEKNQASCTLVKGKHYTVTKKATFSKNKKVGLAKMTITIKGKGNFTGTKKLTGYFFIGPEKAKIKSLKAGKKKLTVKWKKAKHADGYVIVLYGWHDNKRTVYDKQIYVNSKNTVKKTIKNLKSGYHYDVWVHSYKKMYGDKWYVPNNAMKSVIVK